MKIYFTFRMLNLGGNFYNPNYVFNAESFKGLNISYKYICGDPSKDGRHLGVIEYIGDIQETEIKTIVSEALAVFSYHEKTFDSAKNFAKYITGLSDSEIYYDEDNNLVINYPSY